jgi:Fe-S cluster assembly protein SufD
MMNAEIKPMRTAAELKLMEAFSLAKAQLPGGPQMTAQRLQAFRRFEELGLPHRRIEEWKYTDLRTLMRDAKPLSPPRAGRLQRPASEVATMFAAVTTRRLVFVDGVFVRDLSDLSALPPGLSIRSMAASLAAGDPMLDRCLGQVVPTADVAVALNTAFMGDGAVIHIAADTVIDTPLHLAFVFASPAAAAIFARTLVVVESGAKISVLESFEGPDSVDYQVNTALELVLGPGARVNHVKVGSEGLSALHLSTVMAELGPRAVLNDLSFTTGGAVNRNQLFVNFAGEQAQLTANSATLIKGRQHVDTTIVVDHAAPGGRSRELNKSVLDDDSRGIFQGKIIVRPGAQKTDGKMMSHALLLSDRAEADNKPELEIFADDVQCGHGATAGALDPDLLFYVKSRGVPPRQAEALLIAAFVGEAVDVIEHEAVREALLAAATRWLQTRM